MTPPLHFCFCFIDPVAVRGVLHHARSVGFVEKNRLNLRRTHQHYAIVFRSQTQPRVDLIDALRLRSRPRAQWSDGCRAAHRQATTRANEPHDQDSCKARRNLFTRRTEGWSLALAGVLESVVTSALGARRLLDRGLTFVSELATTSPTTTATRSSRARPPRCAQRVPTALLPVRIRELRDDRDRFVDLASREDQFVRYIPPLQPHEDHARPRRLPRI